MRHISDVLFSQWKNHSIDPEAVEVSAPLILPHVYSFMLVHDAGLNDSSRPINTVQRALFEGIPAEVSLVIETDSLVPRTLEAKFKSYSNWVKFKGKYKESNAESKQCHLPARKRGSKNAVRGRVGLQIVGISDETGLSDQVAENMNDLEEPIQCGPDEVVEIVCDALLFSVDGMKIEDDGCDSSCSLRLVSVG